MRSLTATLAADNPLGHVVDVPLLRVGDMTVLTLHTVTLTFTTILLIWVMLTVAKNVERGSEKDGPGKYVARGRFSQMIEVVCLYLREKIVQPQLGPATDRFIGFIWTIFFFILFANLFGMVPLLDLQHVIGGFGWGDSHWAVIGGTATGNIAVTAVLAVITFFVIQIAGLRSLGVVGWARHFTAGAPWYLWPVMIPVEILGMFIKPFALAVRLFANMVAGHTLLATLLLFTKMGLVGLGMTIGGGAISLLALIGAIPIFFLEVLVAFIQAFIFTVLTTVFIGQLVHHHDEHEHGAESVPAHA